MAKLIGFICPIHGYVNVEKTNGLCPHCNASAYGERRRKKTFFDVGMGREVNVNEIDKICKEKGLVYGGDDLTREAAQNKQYNEQKFSHQIQKELKERLLYG